MTLRKYIVALAAVAVCLGAFVPAASAGKKPAARTLKPAEAADKVISLAAKYFTRGKTPSLDGDVTEESGLYRVRLTVGKSSDTFFLTKDGSKLIFSNGVITIDQYEEAQRKKEAAETAPLPQAEKPTVELFVMSLCPYGIKAARDILPVAQDFGAAIDFRMKYIVNVNGDTLKDVSSLHGAEEVREDCRQAAIMKYYPALIGPYLDKLKKNSCLLSCGEMQMEDHWKKAAGELKIDAKKIDDFLAGSDAMLLLKRDAADADKYKVTASPTLYINGVKSTAIRRGKQGIRAAFCSAFTKQPESCKGLDEPTAQPAVSKFTVIDAGKSPSP